MYTCPELRFTFAAAENDIDWQRNWGLRDFPFGMHTCVFTLYTPRNYEYLFSPPLPKKTRIFFLRPSWKLTGSAQ